MSTTNEIVEAINQYRFEGDNWLDLDALLEQLWATEAPQQGREALFGIFERYPEDDGYGVFWSIVHGLESLPDYEPVLVVSLRRRPTEFNTLMINRILNAGQENVGGVSGWALLSEVLGHPKATLAAQRDAERYLERHAAANGE